MTNPRPPPHYTSPPLYWHRRRCCAGLTRPPNIAAGGRTETSSGQSTKIHQQVSARFSQLLCFVHKCIRCSFSWALSHQRSLILFGQWKHLVQGNLCRELMTLHRGKADNPCVCWHWKTLWTRLHYRCCDFNYGSFEQRQPWLFLSVMTLYSCLMCEYWRIHTVHACLIPHSSSIVHLSAKRLQKGNSRKSYEISYSGIHASKHSWPWKK